MRRNDNETGTWGLGSPRSSFKIIDAKGNVIDLSPMVEDIYESKQLLKALVFLTGQAQNIHLSEDDIANL